MTKNDLIYNYELIKDYDIIISCNSLENIRKANKNQLFLYFEQEPPELAHTLKRKWDLTNESPIRPYDYLLNTPVSSFTLEKITELSNTHKKKQNEYEYYLNINDKNLWLHDLKDLLTIL
jgi:hypothetical protein